MVRCSPLLYVIYQSV